MKINFSSFNNRIKDCGVRDAGKVTHSCAPEMKMSHEINKPTNALSFGGFKNINWSGFWGKLQPYLKPAKEGFLEEKIPEYLSEDIPKWAKWLGGSEKFEKIVAATRDNPAIVQALTELGVVGVVRSLIVVATPGVKKGDKETSISKNIVSALTGYGLSHIIFKPLGAATKKVFQNPEKYFKEGSSMLNKMKGVGLDNVAERTAKNAFHNFWNKGPDILLAPLKSALTVALIPVVMGILFKDNPKAKKMGKNAQQAENQNTQNTMNTQNSKMISQQSIENLIIDKNIRNSIDSMFKGGAPR